jgi:RNA polymerase sigma-70 factor (ECF subfamily)
MVALLPELRAYARFLVRGPAEADDLVQEAVARALAALKQYRPGTSMRAWLFTIQRNLFYEQARRRRTERRLLERAGPGDSWTAAEQPGRVDLADLNRHLFTLPPLLREALVLVGAQGLSHEEAAAICGVPVGTMKARVSRARGQLARVMQTTLPCDG